MYDINNLSLSEKLKLMGYEIVSVGYEMFTVSKDGKQETITNTEVLRRFENHVIKSLKESM